MEAIASEANGTMSQETTKGDEWRAPPELYEQLDTVPPEARAAIVLGIIERIPKGASSCRPVMA